MYIIQAVGFIPVLIRTPNKIKLNIVSRPKFPWTRSCNLNTLSSFFIVSHARRTIMLNYMFTYEKLGLPNIYILATRVVNLLNAFLLTIFPYVTCYIDFHVSSSQKYTIIYRLHRYGWYTSLDMSRRRILN